MRRKLAAVCAAFLLAPLAASAFEGTLKLRTVSVGRDKLGTVTGGTAPTAEQILAIMPAQLLAAKDAGAAVHEGTVYVSGSKVRMDLPTERGGSGYAIIDTERGLTWLVVPKEKRYIEWSEADAKAMGEKMAQVEKMMKERMASLPPEQRQQVEAMLKNMKGPGGDQPAPKIDLQPLGKTKTVNGAKASAFQVKTGDTTTVGWITEDQPDLAKALRTVQERMQKLTPASLRGRESARTALSDKGLPVMVQTLDPQHYRVEEVVTVEPGAVSGDLFTVPKEYAKTTGRDAMKALPEK